MRNFEELINDIFLISPSLKKQLKEVFQNKPENEKRKITRWMDEITEKQNKILSYLIEKNPDFVAKLKQFVSSAKATFTKDVENQSRLNESADLDQLEQEINNA